MSGKESAVSPSITRVRSELKALIDSLKMRLGGDADEFYQKAEKGSVANAQGGSRKKRSAKTSKKTKRQSRKRSTRRKSKSTKRRKSGRKSVKRH